MSAPHEKRSISVSVKMTPSQLKTIKKAAEHLWPGALLSQSGMVLGEALLCADNVLGNKRKGKGGTGEG